MRMTVICAHHGAESVTAAVSSWMGEPVAPILGMVPPDLILNKPNLQVYITSGRYGMLTAFQHGFGATGEFDILAYLHDDTIINVPNWAERVRKEFEDPTVGLVGFGGGTGHGTAGLYRTPYDYHQLARTGFRSNMMDAENHGARFTGECDVAVLDGFALIVRREVLEKAGGWPLNTPIGYVCYDYWLSCMTRRLGYRIRLVGVPCQHLGGQTFVKLGIGKDPKHWEQYIESHRYIYDEFKDVLPARV